MTRKEKKNWPAGLMKNIRQLPGILNAYKYHSIVKENGTIDLPTIPLPQGARVEIITFIF